MKITQLEQSGVILETNSGFKLAIDIASLTPMDRLESVALPDAMLVSHIHGDHFSVPHIKKLHRRSCI
jgi:L-ascorbate metabolism protein UlaG (beta-lactamase superfamily)